MATYQFCCEKHGNFDVFQGMNEEHNAICPKCGNKANRVYTPIRMKQKIQMGKDRVTLFNELAQQGFAHKNWESQDSYLHAARGETVNTEAT